jgi:hypothetical protein
MKTATCAHQPTEENPWRKMDEETMKLKIHTTQKCVYRKENVSTTSSFITSKISIYGGACGNKAPGISLLLMVPISMVSGRYKCCTPMVSNPQSTG